MPIPSADQIVPNRQRSLPSCEFNRSRHSCPMAYETASGANVRNGSKVAAMGGKRTLRSGTMRPCGR